MKLQEYIAFSRKNLTYHHKLKLLNVIVVSIFSSSAAMAMIASFMPFLALLTGQDQGNTFLISDIMMRLMHYNENPILVSSLLTFSLIVISNSMQVIRIYLLNQLTFELYHHISMRLAQHYLKYSHQHLLTVEKDSYLTKILSESEQIVQNLYRPLGDFLSAILTILMIMLYLYYEMTSVALMLIGFIAISYIMIVFIVKRLANRYGEIRSESNQQRFEWAEVIIDGHLEIYFSRTAKIFLNKFSQASERMVNALAKFATLNELPTYIMHTVAIGSIVAFCAYYATYGENSDAGFMEIFPMLGVLAMAGQRMLPELSRAYRAVGSLAFAAGPVSTISQELERVTRANNEIKVEENFEHLELKNISFDYPNGETILKDFSLRINKGDKICFIGASGSGKSTLVKIIAGLLQPTTGHVCVNGIIQKSEVSEHLRNLVSFVPQSHFLFNASFEENIDYNYRSEIGEHNINRLIKNTNLMETHRRFQKKQDDRIGRHGDRLSGGQQQRLSIARALFLERDILILDEPSSSLDQQNQSSILEMILSEYSDKTIIMVSHRAETMSGFTVIELV